MESLPRELFQLTKLLDLNVRCAPLNISERAHSQCFCIFANFNYLRLEASFGYHSDKRSKWFASWRCIDEVKVLSAIDILRGFEPQRPSLREMKWQIGNFGRSGRHNCLRDRRLHLQSELFHPFLKALRHSAISSFVSLERRSSSVQDLPG